MATNSQVELGFIEECEPNLVLSHQFPSKVGGKPAWLSLNPFPTDVDLSCTLCKGVLTFLLQLYSPSDRDCAFHRTLFIFVCRNPTCCQKNSNQNLKVFRSQLSKLNEFYSTEPPSPRSLPPESVKNAKLCCLCGNPGPKRCSKCQIASYCSKEHQTVDWKNGHKNDCAMKDENQKKVLFPQYELVIESENWVDDVMKPENQKMEEYNNFLKSEKSRGLLNEVPVEEFENFAKKDCDDKYFFHFKKRIEHEPDQVIRYEKGGKPLWVSREGVPIESDIPYCVCGSKRQFEFQVMPQLLNNLNVDSVEKSLDWGTLCVYTCEKDCPTGNNYLKEFIWKQDY